MIIKSLNPHWNASWKTKLISTNLFNFISILEKLSFLAFSYNKLIDVITSKVLIHIDY